MENQHIAIVPTLTVSNGASAIEFYKMAFEATVLMANTESDGSVVAEMAIQNARFVVADESPEHGNLSPDKLGGHPFELDYRLVIQIPFLNEP